MIYSYRIVVPLATLTVVGLLATDLYLPAVPSLPEALNGTVLQAQTTLFAFVASLALAQLVWGATAEHYGLRHCLIFGTTMLLVGSVLAALSTDFNMLIAARALQGFGAAAATVVVPVFLRQQFGAHDSLRAIAALGMAECVVPAIGPVVGAMLLRFADWRAAFWTVALLTAASLWQNLRIVPHDAKQTEKRATTGGYRALLLDFAYMRMALSHAASFAALLTFVTSIPQVLATWSSDVPRDFAAMQIASVAAFMVCAARTANWVRRWGEEKVLVAGAAIQLVSVAAIAYLAVVAHEGSLLLGFWWMTFGAAHGVRGPVGFAKALSLSGRQEAKGSGLLIFLTLAVTAGGIQFTALFLAHGLTAVAVSFGMLTAIGSFLLLPEFHAATRAKREN